MGFFPLDFVCCCFGGFDSCGFCGWEFCLSGEGKSVVAETREKNNLTVRAAQDFKRKILSAKTKAKHLFVYRMARKERRRFCQYKREKASQVTSKGNTPRLDDNANTDLLRQRSL